MKPFLYWPLEKEGEYTALCDSTALYCTNTVRWHWCMNYLGHVNLEFLNHNMFILSPTWFLKHSIKPACLWYSAALRCHVMWCDVWNSKWNLVAAALPLNHLQEDPIGNLVQKKKSISTKTQADCSKNQRTQKENEMSLHPTGWLAGWLEHANKWKFSLAIHLTRWGSRLSSFVLLLWLCFLTIQKEKNKRELIFLCGTPRENKRSCSELEFLSVLPLSLSLLFYHGTASEQTGRGAGCKEGIAALLKKMNKIPLWVDLRCG